MEGDIPLCYGVFEDLNELVEEHVFFCMKNLSINLISWKYSMKQKICLGQRCFRLFLGKPSKKSMNLTKMVQDRDLLQFF